MKNVLVFFITLLMISLFVACSAEKAEQPADSQQRDSYEDVSSDENSGESSNKSSDENNNEDGDAKLSDIADAPLPKGYPEALVPIISKGKSIISAGGNAKQADGSTSVWVKVLSSEKPGEVAAFYKEVLSGASGKKDEEFGGIYFLEGTLEGMEIKIKVNEQVVADGFPSTIFVEIAGIGAKEEQSEKSGNTADIGKVNTGLLNEDKIPKDYNRDLVPLIEGSNIRNADEMEQNGNKLYVLVCYSELEKEKVLEFYKDVLKNAAQKEEGTLGNGSYYFNGKLENAKFYFVIGEEDVTEEYKSFYNLTLEMLK